MIVEINTKKEYLDMYMALIDEMLADPTKDHTWLPRCNYMVTQAVYEYLVPLYAGRCVMRKELKDKEMLFKASFVGIPSFFISTNSRLSKAH